MALITCQECGNQVSATAKACPQCGASGKALTGAIPKKMGTLSKLAIGFVGFCVVTGIVNTAMNPNPPASPEQQAAESENNARNTNIVLYAKSLKAAARNPDSIVFERVLANGDGSLTCFKYPGENGFGGKNREWAAFTPAGGANKGAAVKIICEDKVMEDVTAKAVPLIKLMS